MRFPEVIPDSQIDLKKSPMPKGLSAIPLTPANTPWSTRLPDYDQKVPCWVAQSVVDAFKQGKARSPFEPPEKNLRDSKGEKLVYANGFPLNPQGRTGRNQNLGLMWCFGPSFTADAVMVWNGKVLLGKRASNGMWALIGGFNDAGEELETTAKREVFEETGFKLSRKHQGKVLAVCQVPDTRASDHCWIETTAFKFELTNVDVAEQSFRPNPTEIIELRWWPIRQAARQKLHAGHERIIQLLT